jgi:hypothetical protein
VRYLRVASLLALAVFAASATTSSAALSGPTGLHGFLLRANEPADTSFTRTPSFAWNPVPGARTYQFQLSLSSTFRDSGIVYNDGTLTTPVSAPTLTLPWISDALYARVRADLGADTTPWSAPFRFDVTPPAAPSPLPSYPGVLRWTPTEGADGYQVWLLNPDPAKLEFVRTNVLDEREFYTFHQSAQWIGAVRWRVRAVRGDQFKQRINGLPVSQHGPWSDIYTSSNPAPTPGPIQLIGTVSDVFSDGSANSPAHEMTPAFLWRGNQTSSGTTVNLFRVEVFTDKQCLNLVYTGAAVGSPAWAPRLNGTLALPKDAAGLISAQTTYLGDGTESSSYTLDGDKLEPVEQQAQATPTTAVPGDIPAFPGTSAPGATTDPSAGGASGSTGSGITVTGNVGPPVSLWDIDWPQNGYYWTVMPVVPVQTGGGTTVAAPGVLKAATVIPVLDTTGFVVGDTISIGQGPGADSGTITAVGGGAITIGTPTVAAHPAGDAVINSGGSLRYVDAELAQDLCKLSPPQRLGISSEPSLTSAAQAPFASGLSSTGRLTSAATTSTFYGSPLIAWTPAFNADIYEVQYSKTAYPFKPELDPRSKVKGFLTFSTSDVLPLAAGTWYYRVRGIDYNLPTGVQQMSWSDPTKLVVAPPKFAVTPTTGKKFKVLPSKTTAKTKTKAKASAPTTLVLRFTVANASETEKDVLPKGVSAGDTLIVSYKLKNIGAQLGRTAGALVGSGRDTITFTSASAVHIDEIVALPGGTLSFSGDGTPDNPATSLAVTGGTGSFAGARGTYTSTKTVVTYTLRLPGA